MGDPAGIGPEVIVRGFQEAAAAGGITVIGDAEVLQQACDSCGIAMEVREVDTPHPVRDPAHLPVIQVDDVQDHQWGEIDAAYGRASLAYIDYAADLAENGVVDAMVTAPIHKQAVRQAGSEHPGHTGRLAARSGTDQYTMLLVEGALRVSHVSTHVSLRSAIDLITADRICDTIRLTANGISNLGISDPRIAVAGLNPHASDGGLLGSEETDCIAPAVQTAAADGIDVIGPEPPDTVFGRALSGECDGVVAMYHDQGHIPVKLLGVARDGEVSGVNVTLGLPIIRTSVDHGTAFDIAGQGIASPRSFIQAVELAADLATTA